MEHCNIRELSKCLIKCENIREIYLSNNHIPLIPHYITKLSNSVEIFDISHNQIPVIDAQEILKWLGGRIRNIKLV